MLAACSRDRVRPRQRGRTRTVHGTASASAIERPYTRRTLGTTERHKDTVTTTIRNGDDSTIVLDVEIDQRQLQAAIDEGVRHLGRRTRVPGFRPGKVPRPMLERVLGVRRSDPDSPNPIYD